MIILIQNKWDNKNKTNYRQIMFLNNILNRIICLLMNKIINQLEINIENKRITRNQLWWKINNYWTKECLLKSTITKQTLNRERIYRIIYRYEKWILFCES